MKFTQAQKSYGGVEGWVTRGQVFNVGQEHRPGLKVITEKRAHECLKAGLHREYTEGDVRLAPAPGDPVVIKRQAALALSKEDQRQRAMQKRQDDRRKTKVDPPPANKKGGQTQDPPAPPRAPGVRRQPASPTSESQPPNPLPAGGQTGPEPGSSSSSPEDPPSAPSTSKRRGMRRGEPAHKKRARAGSQSTKAGEKSPGETPSTPPTSTGGAQTRASRDSQD